MLGLLGIRMRPNADDKSSFTNDKILLLLLIVLFLTPFRWFSHVEESGKHYLTGWTVEDHIVPKVAVVLFVVYLISSIGSNSRVILSLNLLGVLGSLFLVFVLFVLHSEPISGAVMVGNEFSHYLVLAIAIAIALLGSIQLITNA